MRCLQREWKTIPASKIKTFRADDLSASDVAWLCVSKGLVDIAGRAFFPSEELEAGLSSSGSAGAVFELRDWAKRCRR